MFPPYVVILPQNKNQLSKVIETNQFTERFGLTLSQEDAAVFASSKE